MRAEIDIKIGGTVDGGRVCAAGSIEIVGGVIGRESGSVRAGGDLSLRHALGARLYAQGRLVVARSVSTSQLVAKEIEIGGKLLSESAQAETRIVLKDAGSPAGGPCVLRAAYPLSADEPIAHPQRLKADAPSKRAPRPVESLRERKRRCANKQRADRPPTAKQLEIEARRVWRCRQRELQSTAVIEIHGTAHAGCRLDFGVSPLVLEEDVKAQRFLVDPDTQKIIAVEI